MSTSWRGFTLPTLDEFMAYGWDDNSDEWVRRHYGTACQAAVIFTAFPKTKTVRGGFPKDMFYGLHRYTGGTSLIDHGYLSREAWKIAMRAAGFTVSADGYKANVSARVDTWAQKYVSHGARHNPKTDLDAPAFPDFLRRVADALDLGDELDRLGLIDPRDRQVRGPMFSKETKA